jgi:hypothetical protein
VESASDVKAGTSLEQITAESVTRHFARKRSGPMQSWLPDQVAKCRYRPVQAC